MTTLRATIELHTAFGTPLAGDTLFGQLCWSAREHLGDETLARLLKGYTSGKPWLVVSDGFPSGYLPKPTVPAAFSGAYPVSAIEIAPTKSTAQIKEEKAKRWIALDDSAKPLSEMLAAAVSDAIAFSGNKPVEAPQPHNSINRRTGTTGTTGEESFAPYTQPQIFFARGQRMDVCLVLDETRMSQAQLLELLQAVGSQGYGRDASIGLGKFTVCPHPNPLPQAGEGANAYLALAPCAPQRQSFDGDKSYWRVITRFGRHGNRHGVSEKPFKNPVLLAATGAVFVPRDAYSERAFIGQGLGGNGQLSKIEPATVQQGYAPVIGIGMGV